MARKTAKKTTALAHYKSRLAAMAKRVETAEKVTGSGFPKIEIQSAQFYVDGDPVDGNELEVVVLTAIHANTYYVDDWDPKVVSLPVCYAFGDPKADDPEAEMAPHPEAEEPQHDNCAECPLNQFGSAPRGNGKACKNTRRLALMLAEDLDDIAAANVRVLTVSPTNLKRWSSYANMVAKNHTLPPIGVVTRIRIEPDSNQYRLIFSVVKEIEFDDDMFEAIMARAEEADTALTAPYQKREEVEEKSKRKAPAKRTPQKASPVKRTAVKRTTTARKKF